MKRPQIINKNILLPLLLFCVSFSFHAQFSISGPSSANINETKSFSISNSGGGNIVNTQWSTTSLSSTIVSGQGSTNVSIRFTSIGSGQIRATVLNSSFNSTYLTKNFTVNGTVVGQVSITSGPTFRCKGGGTTDYNASASNATSYSWSLSPTSAGSINSSGTISWSSSFSGTATVSVTANGPNSSSSSASRFVTVESPPSATSISINNATICSGETTRVRTTNTVQGNIYKLYRNGTYIAQETATGFGQLIDWNTLSTAGTYYVIVEDPGGNCGDSPQSNSVSLTVNQGLGSGITLENLDNSTRCQGSGTTDFRLNGGSGTNSYDWSISGGGTISGSGRNITVNWSPTASGTSTISVEITSQCGDTTTRSTTVTTDSAPSATTISINNATICSGETTRVRTTNTVQGNIYKLYRNGTYIAQETAAGFGQLIDWNTVSTAGTYYVIVEDPSNSCGDSPQSNSVSLTVNQGLGSGIELENLDSPTRCQGSGSTDFRLNGGSGTNSYDWSISGGGTISGSGRNITVNWLPTTSGTSTISVEVTSQCGDTTTRSTTVTTNSSPSKPVISINDVTICNDEQTAISVVNGINGHIYRLYRGSGISMGQTTASGFGSFIISSSISIEDTYYVTAENPSNSCGISPQSDSVSLTVNQGLGSGIALENLDGPTRCQGSGSTDFRLNGGSGTNSYDWSISGGGTISGSGRNITVNWSPTASGTSTISVEVTSQCGDMTTLNSVVNTDSAPSPPVISIDNTAICDDDQATISIGNGQDGFTYTLYRVGNGTAISSFTASIPSQFGSVDFPYAPNVGGTYYATAEDPSNSCGVSPQGNSVSLTVSQGLGSNLDLNNPNGSTRCSGVDSWNFNVTGGNSTNTYSNWSVSNAGSSTISGSGRNATVDWAANFGFGNTATVSVLVTSQCGDNITLSTTVTANSGPSIYALQVESGDEQLCVGGSSILYIPRSQDGVNYTLYRDGGFPVTKPGTQFSERVDWTVDTTGTYTVVANDGGSCGTQQMGDPITIIPATDIEIEITADQDLANICAGTPVTLTVATTNGTTFSNVEWNTGATTESIMVSPLANNTWTYEVSVRDPNCGNYITESITITPFTPTEWYTDSDGDGLGDAFGSPLLSCDDPGGNYVDNNDDLCPNQAGNVENSGCPPGLEPENRNTVTTWVYDLAGNVKVSNKAYYDELGKLEQTQAYDVKSDSIWASATLYDEYGRTALQTLSSPVREGLIYQFKDGFIKRTNNSTEYDLSDYDGANGNDPNPVGDAPTTLGWYYSENNTREPYQDVTDYPFSKSVYSNLNPGTVLRTMGGNKVNGIWPQSYAFSMKASGELALNPAFGETQYNGIETTKTVSRDVHGVENVVFTDTDGKVLAAARSGVEGQTSSPLTLAIPEQGFVDIHIPEGITGISTSNNTALDVYSLIGDTKLLTPFSSLPSGFYRIAVKDLENYTPNSITVTYRVNYYDYTLNEYDEADRLVATYQPLGATKAQKPATTFEYNTLGQLIRTTSPDEGTAEFKYREDGQIRFSQNSKQLALGEFSYTNYDTFGRPIESGVVISTAFNGSDPDNGASPTGAKKEQQLTTYDSADDTALATALGARASQYPTQSFVAGNVTHTANDQAETWYAYDVYGRVKWLVQRINGLGVKTIDYEYDPVEGLVTKVIYQKEQADQFIHRYGYDNNDQLAMVETSADGITFEENANYTYYETGALKRTELAGGTQGMDYVYNLQGQLKGINHPSLSAMDDPGQDANDLFGMQLDYHPDDYKRSAPNINQTTYGSDRLNGNIKSIRWNNTNPNTSESQYVYEYNRNDWLTGANFDPSGSAVGTGGLLADDSSAAQYANGQTDVLEATNSYALTTGFHAQTGSSVTVRIDENGGGSIMDGDYDVSNITYDANGNIVTLNRNKGSQNGANAMDELAYTYKTTPQDGPNQLVQVADGIASNADAEDIDSQGTNNYVYNAIGQLIRNNAEDVDYSYNTTGLVTEVKKGGLTTVKFYYNDRNHRIRKETFDGEGFSFYNTYYVRDVAGQVMAIYNDFSGSIDLAEQPVYGNSRVAVAYNSTGNTKNYIYELTDHLGNVRAVFTKNGANNGDADAYTDYYPFGMQMPGRNVTGDYRYAFQGQEKDFETGNEAFELRLWDSRIGRWLTTDPAGQYSSPYLGMGNNPISMIDPDGGFARPPRTGLGRFLKKIGNGISNFWHKNFSRMRPLKKNTRRYKRWMQRQGGPRYVQNRRSRLNKTPTLTNSLVLKGLTISGELLLEQNLKSDRIESALSFRTGLTFPGARVVWNKGALWEKSYSNTIYDPDGEIPAIASLLSSNPGSTVRIDFPRLLTRKDKVLGERVTVNLIQWQRKEYQTRHHNLARKLKKLGISPNRVHRGFHNRLDPSKGTFFGDSSLNIITIIPLKND